MVQNREYARLVALDDFSEIVRRAAADSLQQFDIVTHGLVARPPAKLICRPVAAARNELVRKIIGMLLKIGNLLALFISRNGTDFAVKFHAFNRQISLNAGDF
jgi:hypothetical protein